MDLRKHTRVTVESQCTAKFRLGGLSYSDIPVSNLGANGCCFEIPSRNAGGIKNLSQLDGVELQHPGLPKESVKAKVVWVHSKKGAEKEYVQTGIQFSGASDGYRQEVDRYVSALLKAPPSTSM